MARYVCAWCRDKGITTYLNDIEFEGDKDSDGICKECAKEAFAEVDLIKEYNETVGVKNDNKKEHKVKN